MNVIKFPEPQLQIDFAFALKQIRQTYLQDALSETVGTINIVDLDSQLQNYVPHEDLSKMAKYGLRGELLFAVPIVLEKNPRLIGYYRLLMGYSQKDFYGTDKGFCAGRFRTMETKGIISKKSLGEIHALCAAFCNVASALLKGIDVKPLRLNRELLDDLTLLTVGPQLRGGANNKRGSAGVYEVFELIREIVAHAAIEVESNLIKIKTAAGPICLIEFAPDPDIVIRTEMGDDYRNVIAIEIKSGTDVSNIHNRIGEAEKSHQKAKQDGFNECWTIVNVRRLDREKAQKESPSTNRFYCLSMLAERSGEEYGDFRNRIISLTGISES